MLKLNSDFTVTLNANQDADPGGAITLLAPLPAGFTLTATSAVPELQPMVLTNLGRFYPTVINDSADRAVILIQQLQEQVNRSIKVPLSESGTNVQLPPVQQRAGRLLGFASDGSLVPMSAGGGGTGDTMEFIQVGFGAVWRTMMDKAREVFSVKDFGAKGNGQADDSDSITRADQAAAAAGRTLFFPNGIYPAHSINMTSSWHMEPGACILYNGQQQGECVRCDASNLIAGDITINCGGLEPRQVFVLGGNNNFIKSIKVFNVTSSNQSWIVRTLYLTGSGNKISSICLDDLVNVGNTNDSSPQGLVLSDNANLNIIGRTVSRNGRGVVVDNSTGNNFYGEIIATECKDNAFYGVASGLSSISSIQYDGENTAAGFRNGHRSLIGLINVARSPLQPVFFGNCGDITIGTYQLYSATSQIFQINLAAAGRITIGSILGSFKNTGLIYLPAENGSIDFLTIKHMDVTVYVDDPVLSLPASFIRLQACKGINFGDINIKIILNASSSASQYYCYLADALTYKSHIDKFRCTVYAADGVTRHPSVTFYGRNFLQENLSITEGHFNTSYYFTDYLDSGFQPGRLTISDIPTSGYWKRGTVLWKGNPFASGVPGWICVTGGTPGTWSSMPNLQ